MIYFGKDPNYNYEFAIAEKDNLDNVLVCCTEGFEAEDIYNNYPNKNELIIIHNVRIAHRERKEA